MDQIKDFEIGDEVYMQLPTGEIEKGSVMIVGIDENGRNWCEARTEPQREDIYHMWKFTYENYHADPITGASSGLTIQRIPRQPGRPRGPPRDCPLSSTRLTRGRGRPRGQAYQRYYYVERSPPKEPTPRRRGPRSPFDLPRLRWFDGRPKCNACQFDYTYGAGLNQDFLHRKVHEDMNIPYP